MKNSFFLPVLFFVLCSAIYIGCLGYDYSFLPERVPSHFDWRGHPNGWMSRASLTLFMGTVSLVLPIFVLAIAAWAPDRFKNLPNRAYWLAPERRDETRTWLLLSCFWFCSFFILFNTAVYYLIVQAALHHSNLNALALWSCVSLFLGATLIWLLFLKARFKLPPDALSASL